MSDTPAVHTGEPLVPLSDDDVAYRSKMFHWTMTEALFLLSGYKPPGYESDRHMQDHFWPAYDQAVRAIEMGKICRKIERAGKRVFIDSPTNWLVWADSLGPKYLEVDKRMRRALSGKTDRRSTRTVLSKESRIKGGSGPRYDRGLQEFINRLYSEFKQRNELLTITSLKTWLETNAHFENGYDPQPEILDCEDIEFYEDTIWWKKSRNGAQKSVTIKAVERYLKRARETASTTPG